jgi:hypothetical protein
MRLGVFLKVIQYISTSGFKRGLPSQCSDIRNYIPAFFHHARCPTIMDRLYMAEIRNSKKNVNKYVI